jgi:hypothetical protein
MDGSALRLRLARLLVVLGVTLAVRAQPAAVEQLPPVEETMARIGRRLSQSHSEQELSALATRGDRLLSRLTREERAVLARGCLRIHVDRPVLVAVAAPRTTAPFWLDDLGFRRLARGLQVAGSDWVLFQRPFPAGWLGLGVNGLDRAAKAHYVVFVRPAVPGQVPALEGIDRDCWRVVPAHEGASAAFDLELPIGPLPPELSGALLLQPAYGRRHATLLARSRVWKTHAASGPRPDQIAVAFGPDPARSLVWTWRTDPSVTGTQMRLVARGAEGSCATHRMMTIAGESQLVETPSVLNDPAIRRHRIEATNLAPDTVYAYSLGDGSAQGWSSWYEVRTGPDRPRSFTLLYMGDPQCGLEEWGKLLSTAYRRHRDAAFLLIAGDLVDRGNERTNWDHFFVRSAGIFERLPLLPCAGNHEYLDQGPRLYRAFFELPATGPPGLDPDLVYAFEYGNAFIAVLDSTLALADPALARKQAEWLDDALARTRRLWKLVMFHHPVYASHPTRESPALGEAWVPIFDKHHIDLVLQGHDHAYQRTYPLRAGRRVTRPDQGTTYVVSVSGTKYYGRRLRTETAVGFTERSTYQTIEIEVPADRLVYRAWDGEGRELDRFTIEKSAPQAGALATEQRSRLAPTKGPDGPGPEQQQEAEHDEDIGQVEDEDGPEVGDQEVPDVSECEPIDRIAHHARGQETDKDGVGPRPPHTPAARPPQCHPEHGQAVQGADGGGHRMMTAEVGHGTLIPGQNTGSETRDDFSGVADARRSCKGPGLAALVDGNSDERHDDHEEKRRPARQPTGSFPFS